MASMNPSSEKVFISSTCYDMIDLRAELESFFRSAGMIPILSDNLSTDFEVSTSQNSIETCLANVRSCDYFVIVLSQRYGPSLKKAGFDDISATHLEYREAVKENKRILMYVRDRLEADRAAWKKHGRPSGFKPVWCSEGDLKILELIEEHVTLEASPKNNWFWTFQNSVQLKQRLEFDFKAASARAILLQLVRSGRIPFLTIEGSLSGGIRSLHARLTIRNLGKAVALHPELIVDPALKLLHKRIRSLAENEIAQLFLDFPGRDSYDPAIRIPTEFRYTTVEGYILSDEGEIEICFDRSGKEPATVHYYPRVKKFNSSQGIGFQVAP
jgi:hypothetical protein